MNESKKKMIGSSRHSFKRLKADEKDHHQHLLQMDASSSES